MSMNKSNVSKSKPNVSCIGTPGDVLLAMDMRTAEVLMGLLGKVGGHPDWSLRGHTEAIFEALQAQGVLWDGLKDEIDVSKSHSGYVHFVNHPTDAEILASIHEVEMRNIGTELPDEPVAQDVHSSKCSICNRRKGVNR